MALINCPKCGKEISDKAELCPGCGAKIKNDVLEAETTREENMISEEKPKRLCEECGTELEENETVCPECGCPVPLVKTNKEKSDKHEQPAKPKKGFLKWGIIGVLCVFMVFAIIAGVKNQEKKKAEEQARIAEEQKSRKN